MTDFAITTAAEVSAHFKPARESPTCQPVTASQRVVGGWLADPDQRANQPRPVALLNAFVAAVIVG